MLDGGIPDGLILYRGSIDEAAWRLFGMEAGAVAYAAGMAYCSATAAAATSILRKTSPSVSNTQLLMAMWADRQDPTISRLLVDGMNDLSGFLTRFEAVLKAALESSDPAVFQALLQLYGGTSSLG